MSSWIKSPEIDIMGTIKWVPFHMLVFFVIGFILSKFQTPSIWIWPILGFCMILSSRVLRAFTQYKRKFRFDKWLLFWTVSHMLAIAISVQILKYFDVSKYIYILLVSSLVLSLFSQTIQTMFRKKDLLMLVMLVLVTFMLFTATPLHTNIDQYFVQSASFVSSTYLDLGVSTEPVEKVEESNSEDNTISNVMDQLEETYEEIKEELSETAEENVEDYYASGLEDSLIAFDYINNFREEYGKDSISWNEGAYNLAVDRSKDMFNRDYFDHVTPEGTCAQDMQADYGFNSNDVLAENVGGMTYWADGTPVSYTSPNEAVDSWMDSRGHRYNLLYDDHVSGAIGCYKYICVFYSVHNDPYGLGAVPCSTGEEGLAYWDSASEQSGEI